MYIFLSEATLWTVDSFLAQRGPNIRRFLLDV
jgi:hypothetical protein